MKQRSQHLLMIISAVLVLYGRDAEAQNGRISVVVLHSAQNEATVRLAAELSALGYSAVLLLRPNEPLYPDQVRSIMQDYRAQALLNAVSMTTRVDIWFPTPGAGGSLLTVETITPPGGEGNAAPTILKTVEALRAGLLKLNIAPPTRLAARKSASPKQDMYRDSSDLREGASSYPRGEIASDGGPRFKARPGKASLLIGPAITYGFAEYPPEWQVLLEGSIVFGKYLSLIVAGYAPTAPLRLENEAGSVRIYNGSVILGLRAGFVPLDRRFVPYAAVGFGPQFTRVKGEAEPPYTTEEDRFTTLALLFQSGFRLWLTERVGLELGLHIGDCFPKPQIHLGPATTSFSRPLFGGSALVSIELF